MAVNKVIYGNNTLIDLTDATALASDVVSGKFFYGKDGVKTEGTMAGSLEYEEGTFSPTENIGNYIIKYANQHTKTPALLTIADATGNGNTTSNSMRIFIYIDTEKMFGVGFPTSSSVNRYGAVYLVKKFGSSLSTANYIFQYSSDNQTSSYTSYPRYWASETQFNTRTDDTDSGFWEAGRTYKWLAIWK